MKKDIERRYVPIGELRARTEGDKTLIKGQAAVFNSLSEDLGGFREIIEPGFFSEVLGDDVRALWNHNSDKPLARSANGTLKLAESADGLEVEFEPNGTSWSRDAVEAIKRGDVTQMSFAFRIKPDGDKWNANEEGVVIRRLLKGGAAELYDVSPVTYPAYPETSVGARERAKALAEELIPPIGQAAAGDMDASKTRAQARLDVLRKKIQIAEEQ